jgi:hypothetical protein
MQAWSLLQPAMASLLLTLAASPQADTYTTFGMGAASCGGWLDERRHPDWHAGQQWVLGFVAGVTDSTGFDPMAKTDSQGIWAWIDRYCSEHPTKSIVNAAEAFSMRGPD